LVELRRLGGEGLNQYTWHKSEPRLVKDETREFRSLWGWSRPGDRSRTGSGQMSDSSEGTRAKIILALSGFRDLSLFVFFGRFSGLQNLLKPSLQPSPVLYTMLFPSFKPYSFHPSNLTPSILKIVIFLSFTPLEFLCFNTFILITLWFISFSLLLSPFNKTGWCMQEKGSEKNRSRFRIVHALFRSRQEQ